ncbi:uncharacterized protein LOC129910160 [Episyrphus balteatus]|uniref:uncharacterized protein LOC129910160 n=1 Tax=Episyrphus balteatus TaxID=286459 RepID=UPI002486C448|nr:uncharacterized protein LOC129910160 [Episyrphus balteatus]XP_055843408.1 uncharacterized protein LOC129910160 [Episyrphus balteatus]
MTVKIANLLTPPPTSSIATATLTTNGDNNHHYYLKPYDHFSKTTTFDTFFTMPFASATSIMTNRDHPFNQSTQSTRPLLADRKPPQLLGKKKFNNGRVNNNGQQHQYQQQQQQHRESGVKVQGINDFDIISQQYKYLNSHHLGYPYGSPPSPTANSSDFVFSDTTTMMSGSGGGNGGILAPSSRQPLYENGSSSSPAITRTYDSNYYCNTSRFEDDFCCRRNDQFDSIQSPFVVGQINNNNNNSSSSSDMRLDDNSRRNSSDGVVVGGISSSNGGPFIFGVHHRAPPGGRDFLDSTAVICDRDATYSMEKGQKSMSNSDTSSSSRDSGKGSKLLVKNRKSSKKISKDKKLSISNNNKENRPQIKCVVVGDADIGKTNLIVTYLENRFISEHVPTASDIYNAEVMVNDSPVQLTLCDTAGQDTLDPLRELCYPDSDVFLLCFSVVKPETFQSIKTKWAPKFSKNPASLILVGTQSDLRSNIHVLNKLQTKGEKPISFADAWDLATSIKAKYIETSSYTQDKVKDVFDSAIWEALVPTTLPPTPPLWKKIFCLV